MHCAYRRPPTHATALHTTAFLLNTTVEPLPILKDTIEVKIPLLICQSA